MNFELTTRTEGFGSLRPPRKRDSVASSEHGNLSAAGARSSYRLLFREGDRNND